jgi:peptidyl-prolyl cis-trans isomerase B (cyclophilin B)
MKSILFSVLFSFSLFAQTVVLETSMGNVEITLNPTKAPNTVKNFLQYVESGFYNGTIFHRVINNFMVQGGGFDKEMKEKPTKSPIKNEANNGLLNEVGTISMARTSDPHSASSQFFININDNSFLNFTSESNQGWGYAVFGKVSKGMDIVNKMKLVKTGFKGPHGDVPLEPIKINKAFVKK